MADSGQIDITTTGTFDTVREKFKGVRQHDFLDDAHKLLDSLFHESRRLGMRLAIYESRYRSELDLVKVIEYQPNKACLLAIINNYPSGFTATILERIIEAYDGPYMSTVSDGQELTRVEENAKELQNISGFIFVLNNLTSSKLKNLPANSEVLNTVLQNETSPRTIIFLVKSVDTKDESENAAIVAELVEHLPKNIFITSSTSAALSHLFAGDTKPLVSEEA